jgi:hypothetical protein
VGAVRHRPIQDAAAEVVATAAVVVVDQNPVLPQHRHPTPLRRLRVRGAVVEGVAAEKSTRV